VVSGALGSVGEKPFVAKREEFEPQTVGQSVTSRVASEKYQRILDAAVSVIAEKGFHVARISDIADRAGVADGTIYLYFKNKDEILMAAINSAFDAFVKDARTELAAIQSPSLKLRHLIQMHLGRLGENRNLAIVFQMELRQSARFLAPFSHQHMVEYFGIVRDAIREGQRQNVFREDLDDKIAARCFFGAIEEMVTSWVLAQREYPLVEVAEKVASIILSGIEQ
jgi:TetR/AcrR family fatty acid metabolism transcriptional regulator